MICDLNLHTLISIIYSSKTSFKLEYPLIITLLRTAQALNGNMRAYKQRNYKAAL